MEHFWLTVFFAAYAKHKYSDNVSSLVHNKNNRVISLNNRGNLV